MNCKTNPTQLMMSVVIPVYNKAATIEKCIDSIAEQTCDSAVYEALLVDDGSTDDSLMICRSLELKYNFIRVFTQENQGVSAARNAGIRNALGKYILFLDADDSINKQAIELLINSFESFGESVDVVAYRMKYYYPATGSIRRHHRETWLSETGIYPLDEHPFVAQSTMNVCIRNRFEDNIFFDQTIKMGEDQLFVTNNLERTGILGYCAEAEYCYVRDGLNSSTRGNNPLYAFEDMMKLYGYLAELAKRDDKMKRYAYQLILYNFDWRIKSSMLFPTTPDKEENAAQSKRFATLVGEIPSSEIVDSPYLNAYHKAMLVKRFNLAADPQTIEYTIEHSSIRLENETEWQTVVPKIILERCRFKGETIDIKGRYVCPLFLFEDKPTLNFVHNGSVHPIELGPSSFNHTASHYETARAWSFSYSIDLGGKKNMTIDIQSTVGGIDIPNIGIELKPVVHNAQLGWNRIIFRNATVSANRSQIIITHGKGEYQRKMFFYHLKYRKHFERRMGLRLIGRRFSGKRVWLYADLPTSASEGNALRQLIHDLALNDGIVRYYVSNYADELVARYPILQGKIVECRSRLHQVLSLKSELVISSYLERFVYRPLKQPTYNHLGDLAVNQRLVYLQHGILHAHMPWYFSYDRIEFDYEVISTLFEKNNLIENYHFPPSALIDSGAPRLAEIEIDRTDSRKIVFIPSWRAYLVGGTASDRIGSDAAFMNSALYKGICQLIESITESGLLEANDWHLDLKLHPNFGCYQHLFEFNNPRISLIDGTINESDYAIAITDFSSYAFDFVYAGARIVYFLPDHVEFEAGLNHYSKLDLPFDEGFGPYCETAEEVLAALNGIIEEGADSDSATTYREKRAHFFLHMDGKNCERLYVKLKEIADDLHR